VSEAGLRLNLGCGEQTPEGWLNLDSSPGARLARRPLLFRTLRLLLPNRLLPAESWLGADVRHVELTKRWPFGDGSVEAIYSSHFLEHLELEEARHVLGEAHRVLRPGGRIRLVVPDLAAMVDQYLREREESPAEAAAHFRSNTGFFEKAPPRSLSEYLLWNTRRRHNHQLLHDEGLLRAELERAGFDDLARRACGDSDIPGIESIDWPDRFENALCLEGRRT
jgi:SAM-dependent methyltransferase